MDPPEFAKLSGSGNDFICFDGRGGRCDELLNSPERVGRLVRTICRRGLSVGADGVIFACDHEMGEFADLAARHFEPDGTEARLCGNGVACFARWAIESGWVRRDEVKILASAGVVRGTRVDADYVRACIPLPEAIQPDLKVEACGRVWDCDYAETGVPHLVAYVDDLEGVDMPRCGPALRSHPRFAPAGVNANFVRVLGEGRLALRTWEVGVENETLACGTGSAAAAILAAKRFRWPKQYVNSDQPIRVQARGGDELRICFTFDESGAVTDLCIETFVRFVYTGRLHPDLVAAALGEPAQR